MFGNCFFPLFSVFKNNFIFLRLKNLFGNPKWIENKNCSQTQFVKETKNMQNAVFSFYFSKKKKKHTFDLMNLSHLMS